MITFLINIAKIENGFWNPGVKICFNIKKIETEFVESRR